MRRRMLKSKLHRATVTAADLNYVGSITICPHLMEQADIVEFEQVDVMNVTTGARFQTYTMTGERGDCIINGAAARLCCTGDIVVIMSYTELNDADRATYRPAIVQVGPENRALGVMPPGTNGRHET